MFIQTTVDGDKAAQERFTQKRKGAGRKRMSQKGYGDTWKLIPLKKHHSIVCVCVCVCGLHWVNSSIPAPRWYPSTAIPFPFPNANSNPNPNPNPYPSNNNPNPMGNQSDWTLDAIYAQSQWLIALGHDYHNYYDLPKGYTSHADDGDWGDRRFWP